MSRRASIAPSARALMAGAVGLAGVLAALLAVIIAAVLVAAADRSQTGCATSVANAAAPPAPGAIALGTPGQGQRVGATEYGGPGDPGSGTVGASGVSLVAHPDSYAELGGTTFQTATAMGGLAYMTPLRISWAGHSAVAYKRDFGLGGGPVNGLPRVIDLWWGLAGALGIPYEHGAWSGPVTVGRPPASGSGELIGAPLTGVIDAVGPGLGMAISLLASPASDPSCPGGPALAAAALPSVPGPRARLLAGDRAAAPAGAPAAVRGMLAAGNQIAGRPYVYGAAHGQPLSQLAPAYDCSSSVAHLLWGGGLLGAGADPTSGTLESFGAPGPGRWVTIYASAAHVFMYVAGLRWDTWNAAGPGDGSSGIGWHPLVRGAAGFVARHPVGL